MQGLLWANRHYGGSGRLCSNAEKRWLASSLLLVLLDAVHAGDPVARRAVPVLLLRHQLVALRQDADPHHVGRLLAFARRGRIDRRAPGGGATPRPPAAA